MKKTYFENNINALLIFITLILVIIGIIFIYSASLGSGFIINNSKNDIYIKQIIFLIIGFTSLIFFSFYNYYQISRLSWYLYILGIIILIYVVFFGKTIHGAKSWINVFFFSFQPSEITKIFLILTLAFYIEKNIKNIHSISVFVGAFFISIPYLFLILMQPDIGTAIVYIPIIFFMLFVGGVKIRYIASFILIGILSFVITFYLNILLINNQKLIINGKIHDFVKKTGIYSFALSENNINYLKNLINKKDQALKIKNYIKNRFIIFTFKIFLIWSILYFIFYILYFIFHISFYEDIALFFLILTLGFFISGFQQKIFKSHHIQRLIGFTNLEKDIRGMNYNQRQSIIAIGSGGFKGHGLFKGPQTHLNYIPENQTDFIFAVIGEEWGFLGLFIILTLYIIFLTQGLIISYRSKDYAGSLIAIGIVSMFFSHIIINIAMTIGLFPVMGIPLPFLSSGGSSLITNFIGVGLLLNISKRRFVYSD